MKITFPCTRCGKTLKAREDALGRTRRCPICATRVTCPAPAYPAQVVEAEVVATAAPAYQGPAVARFADGGAYDVVAPAPGESSQVEARRPCPMCGETILASAVKCRSCGAVFDSVLEKGKNAGKRSSRRSGRSNSAPVRDLGVGILLIFLGFGLTAFSRANPIPERNGGGRYVIFTGLIFGGIGGTIKGIYGMVRSDSPSSA